MKPCIVAALIAAVSFSSFHARAEEDGAAPPVEGVAASVHDDAEAERPFQIHVDGGMGFSSYGLHAGAIALFQAGGFRIGPTADFSGLWSSKSGGGLAIGGGSRAGDHWTLDLLGEVGASVHHLTGGLLSDDPGASALIPYAGLRAGARWTWGRSDAAVGACLGVWIYARTDLSSRTASYTYEESGWFSGHTTERSEQVRLGGLQEVGLRLAVGFDVRP